MTKSKPESDFFEDLHKSVRVGGSAKAVRLQLNNAYFKESFVRSCIDELRTRNIAAMAGLDEMTPLEKLGAVLLTDTLG